MSFISYFGDFIIKNHNKGRFSIQLPLTQESFFYEQDGIL